MTLSNENVLHRTKCFTSRDVPMGGHGGRASRSPKFSKLQESWSKISHAASEMVTVFSLTFFLVTVVGQ